MIKQARQFQSALLLASLALSPFAAAQVLDVQLNGLEGESRDNALAWLGVSPETSQARANYLYSAQRKVEKSLQALGYYRARVELELTRSKEPWSLVISVEPGEPVLLRQVDVRLLGDAVNDPAFAELLETSPLQGGDVLNHGVYDRFRRSLTSLARRRGYFEGAFSQARVEVEPVSSVADVSLLYDSGKRFNFGAISYDQDIIHESLLSPLLLIEQGEPFDQKKLRDTQIQLQRTGYFSTVILRPIVDMVDDGQVPLELNLFPAKQHSFDLGAGFSTDTRERLSFTWRTPKLNAYGHRQETRIQYSDVNPSGRLTYSIPVSHPLDDVVQFTARLEDNEFGDLNSRQKELGIRRELRKSDWIYSYSLRGLDEAWNSEGIDRQNDYLLPGISLSQRLHGGSLVNPASGFSHWYRAEAGGANVGSDIDLVRLTANFGLIHSLGEKHRFVLRSNLGAAFVEDADRGQLAPSLNFFAGGAQSIRGYGYQSIGNEVTVENATGNPVSLIVGGDRLLTGSAEYQYSFTQNWRGAVFVDAGDAFDEGDFEGNVGAGFGVHYVTQVGAIRLDIANPVTDDDPSWRIHLAIGAEF
ncbi:MAG: outer membrane protein assembly factor [Halieaceae bacterium]|nr:outer membrane protein assembly factor [Halieaceae bacterium]